MSATERAMKAQDRADRLFAQAVDNGFRLALSDPDGRAMLWALYAKECQTEGMADHQRRAVGLAIASLAKDADWNGWQLMREEHDKPKQGTHAEADDEGGEE